jgi:hypothetical protein
MKYNAAPNNGVHPTAKSATLIVNLSAPQLNARRVMPGVRLLRPVRDKYGASS